MPETMPYTHAHPNGLGASWWAHERMSTSSTSSYGQSGELFDVTNRPQQQRENNNRRERPRPRLRQRPIAPLGTREDVENEDYVSPLSVMFHRAHDRYRIAEETRRQAFQADQFLAVSNENAMPNPLRSRQTNATDNFASQQELPEQFNYTIDPQQDMTYSPWIQNAHTEFNRRRFGLVSPEEAMAEDARMFESLRTADLRQREEGLQLNVDAVNRIQPTVQPLVQQHGLQPQTPAITFDSQPRPPPKASEEMVMNIACTICSEHPINVILLPCWHACMCNWCADLCIPTKRNTPFARPPTGFTGKCPKCRVVVKERREIFLG